MAMASWRSCARPEFRKQPSGAGRSISSRPAAGGSPRGAPSRPAKPVIRPSAEVERARDAMDLRHGDAEEPVAAAIFVRIVDARDGGDADQKKIQHHAC